MQVRDAVSSFINWLSTAYEKVNGFFAAQGDAGKFKRDLDDANKNSVPMRFVPGSREEEFQYAAGR
jgi:hypothetical protein